MKRTLIALRLFTGLALVSLAACAASQRQDATAVHHAATADLPVAAIEAACTDLVLDYAWFRDEHDVEGYVALFTSDAELTLQGQTYRGHSAIRERMQAAAAGPATRHLMSTIRIRPDGPDRATGVSYVTVYASDTPVVEGFAVIGNYIDEFVRTPQGWRIARRSLKEAFRYQSQ